MMQLRWCCVLSLAVVEPIFPVRAAPVPPADPPLAMVPAGAPIVIQVRGFHRTVDRLKTLITNAIPDHATELKRQLDEVVKKAVEGRQVVGLAPEAPLFVVFTALPEAGEGLPPVAVVARVVDYPSFRDRLLTEDERRTLKKETDYETISPPGEPAVYFIRSRGHVVIAFRKDVAEQFIKQPPSLKLPPDTAATLLGGDVGLYVNLDAVTRKYGDQIRSARDMLTEMFKPGKAGPASPAIGDFMKQTIEAEFQMALDSRSLVESFDFRPDGLAMHLTAEFAPDSPTARVIKSFARSSLKELGKMPAGSLGYGAAATSPEVVKVFGAWLHGLMGPGAEGKPFQAAMEELAAAGPRWWTSRFDGYWQGHQVWHYEHPERVGPAQLKMFEAASFMVKGKPEVRRNAVSYRGFTLHQVHLTWDFDKVLTGFLPADPPLPEKEKEQLREQMKRQLGDGLNSWFGTDGKVCITINAADWNDARRQLDRYLDGKDTIAEQPAYRDIRKHLPDEATGIYLLDVAHADQLRDLFGGPLTARENAAKPGKVTKPPPPGKPSYLAMAIRLEGRQGGFDLWLPASGLRTCSELFTAAVKADGPP
jgi:hypothetical protein